MIQKKWMMVLVMLLSAWQLAFATPLWQQLPATPALPNADKTSYVDVNGARIWYAVFGKGEPVILLHGGLASSSSWGNQVPVLAKQYQVIVIDSRGHGRSTRDAKDFSYDLMSADVLGVMDALKIRRAAIVGWSDGAIIGLNIAIHHPERISKLFAFGANSDSDQVNAASNDPVLDSHVTRAKQEYEKISPTPKQFDQFFKQLQKLWSSQPHFTKAQLNSIATPTWIVAGDHDEEIKRENTEYMAAEIPNAGLLILPNVSHFAFIQAPELFNDNLMYFLKSVN